MRVVLAAALYVHDNNQEYTKCFLNVSTKMHEKRSEIFLLKESMIGFQSRDVREVLFKTCLYVCPQTVTIRLLILQYKVYKVQCPYLLFVFVVIRYIVNIHQP